MSVPDTSRSRESFEQARVLFPGGVNSPVRAFGDVGSTPVFLHRGSGAIVQDIDGNEFIDFLGSWGPMLQGHGFKPVIDAIQTQAKAGIGFGAPSLAESHLAKTVIDRVPSVEKVRFVNSGTEATMSAVRLARGYTGRQRLLKFDGCFHGHVDSLLVTAGSGVMTLGLPGSPGVPEPLAGLTHSARFNDRQAVGEIFSEFGESLACVIVEPIAGNMGCVLPKPGFLQRLRDLCTEFGALLIFDEVMTGFRVHPGGAQAAYGVTPDLTTLGKVIGGGLPVGAFGGRAEIMDRIAPSGPIYQSGTQAGNPVAMRAGLALVDSLDDKFYSTLQQRTREWTEGLRKTASRHGVPLVVSESCGMFGIFFTELASVESYADVVQCNAGKYAKFFHGMLDNGVYLPPSAYESGFISGAHGPEHIASAIRCADEVMRSMA